MHAGIRKEDFLSCSNDSWHWAHLLLENHTLYLTNAPLPMTNGRFMLQLQEIQRTATHLGVCAC